MSQHTLFKDIYSSFESKNMDSKFVQHPFQSTEFNFGILKLNAISTCVSEKEQDFVFVVDCSGSMSDICSDGRSKSSHICHTLKNMVCYFNDNPNIKLHITVFAFDDGFNTIVERTQITYENINNILLKIEKIRPAGSTDIENALTKSTEYISQIKIKWPDNVISHIFMTDGEATFGNKNKDILKNIVDDNIFNAFIGFGLDHDASLLNYISNHKNSSYHFVDVLEKAGLVYGEILHSALYKHLENVSIHVENGFIYDYKNNCWSETLFVGDIVSEANKIYHLISTTPDECEVMIDCNHLLEENKILVSKLYDPNVDHIKYIYRQRTLQLLFEANKIQITKNELFNKKNSMGFDDHTDLNKTVGLIKDQEKSFKHTLREFIEEMKKYMNDNGLMDDKFLKNLCDDIYISYSTIGTKYGAMYSCARQTSQGTQRCYTVSNTPRDDRSDLDSNINSFQNTSGFPGPPVLRRHRKVSIFDNFDNFDNFNNFNNDNNDNNDNDNDNDDNLSLSLSLSPIKLIHNISDFADTPYLTPTATRLMRDVSVLPDSESDEETQSYL